MTEREQTIAYWLVPSAGDAMRFQRVIDALAKQQGAPRFRPHLSFGSFADKEPDLSGVLKILTGLELQPKEIDASPSFTMSLFVRFEPSDQLLRARRALEACPGFRTSRTFDPHISLCYGAPDDKVPLKEEMNALLRGPVQFDQLVATDITLPVETYADIRLWKQRTVHPIPGSV
ncbi:MAG: hypothetical protein Hens2KO_11460 [Henriciella sp.]